MEINLTQIINMKLRLKKQQRHFVKNAKSFNISIMAWPRKIGASTLLAFYCQYYEGANISIIDSLNFNFDYKTKTPVNVFKTFEPQKLLSVNTEVLLIDGLYNLGEIKPIIDFCKQNQIKTIITTLPNQFNELQAFNDDNTYVHLLTWKDIPSIFDLNEIQFQQLYEQSKKQLGDRFYEQYDLKPIKQNTPEPPKVEIPQINNTNYLEFEMFN